MSSLRTCLSRSVSAFLDKISRFDAYLASPFHRTSVSTAPPSDSSVPPSHNSSPTVSTSTRNFVISPSSCEHSESEVISSGDVHGTAKSGKPKKPLNVLFKEAVGLRDNSPDESGDSSGECGKESKDRSAKLKKSLRELEKEVRELRMRADSDKSFKSSTRKTSKKVAVKDGTKATGFLYSLFKNTSTCDITPKDLDLTRARDRTASARVDLLTREDPSVVKDLPEDITFFVKFLYDKGYFNGGRCLPGNTFDISCFRNSYGREYIKFAAAQFGRDNQVIAKGLSASDLKKVVLFGCPSLAQKTVFAAKWIRSFYEINEENVCNKCALKESCKFKNRVLRIGKSDSVNLLRVMRVIPLYALQLTPPQLQVPDDVKASALKLVNEVHHLSLTPPSLHTQGGNI